MFYIKTKLPDGKTVKTDVTDDCQAVELAGETVRIIENRNPNFKITTVEDLQIANAILGK